MKIRSNLILIAAVALLGLANFISAINVPQKQSPSDLFERDPITSDSNLSCNQSLSSSNLHNIHIQKEDNSSELYMFVDLLPNSSCYNVSVSEGDLMDVRFNYLLNHCGQSSNSCFIEIVSQVRINSLVGVDNVSEGYNLSLQERGPQTPKSHYQMLLEPLHPNDPWKKFALAFLSNTKERYYVLPEKGNKGNVVPLTLYKYTETLEQFVFYAKATNVPDSPPCT